MEVGEPATEPTPEDLLKRRSRRLDDRHLGA
jgi:hypothetical protein